MYNRTSLPFMVNPLPDAVNRTGIKFHVFGIQFERFFYKLPAFQFTDCLCQLQINPVYSPFSSIYPYGGYSASNPTVNVFLIFHTFVLSLHLPRMHCFFSHILPVPLLPSLSLPKSALISFSSLFPPCLYVIMLMN